MSRSKRILSMIIAVMLAAAMTSCKGKTADNADLQPVSSAESAASGTATSSESDSDTASDKASDSDTSKKTESKKTESKKAESKKTESKKTESKKTESKKTESKKTESKSESSKASDSGQNPVMNFIGDYVSDGVTINVKAKGSSDAEFSVKWKYTDYEYSTWKMSGKLNTETLIAEYSDCSKTDYSLDDGEIASEYNAYQSGTGRFIFNDDGTLTWDDDEQNVADGLLFTFKSASEETDDGYIPKSEAVSEVRKKAGTGATIISSYQGYSPDGQPAWVITVEPITNSDVYTSVTYYVGDGFCYADDAADDSDEEIDDDGYIDESVAIANVRQQAGSGATILDSYKGYTPDGFEAWIVTVAPVTTEDGDETVTYYSGYQFCYSE